MLFCFKTRGFETKVLKLKHKRFKRKACFFQNHGLTRFFVQNVIWFRNEPNWKPTYGRFLKSAVARPRKTHGFWRLKPNSFLMANLFFLCLFLLKLNQNEHACSKNKRVQRVRETLWFCPLAKDALMTFVNTRNFVLLGQTVMFVRQLVLCLSSLKKRLFFFDHPMHRFNLRFCSWFAFTI